MVSGVGVTLLRLTEALQHGATTSGCTPPPTRCPRASRTGPRCTARPACRFFLYPDVQWAFPRLRDVVEDLARLPAGRGPRGHGVLARHRRAQGRTPAAAAGHRVGPHRLRPVRRSLRGDLGGAAGWHYLRWFYGQAHRVLCPVADLRAAPPEPRRDAHRHLEPGSGPRGVPPPVPERGLPHGSRRLAPTISW